ncbi:ATP-binding protein [Candidatus Riflebacteria bacterium]
MENSEMTTMKNARKKQYLKAFWSITPDIELEARELLRYFATRINFPLKTIDELSLCVIEGCINAIEHGKADALEMELAWDGEEIEIKILNTDFTNNQLPEIPREEKEPGTKRGWGLHILKKFLDEYHFIKEGNRTVLVMKIRGKRHERVQF